MWGSRSDRRTLHYYASYASCIINPEGIDPLNTRSYWLSLIPKLVTQDDYGLDMALSLACSHEASRSHDITLQQRSNHYFARAMEVNRAVCEELLNGTFVATVDQLDVFLFVALCILYKCYITLGEDARATATDEQ